MPNDTVTAAIAYLATVERFTYHNPAENGDIVIEFRRAWWDNTIQDSMWYAQARDKRGNHVNAKHVTAEYAADILHRYRSHIEATYRAKMGA